MPSQEFVLRQPLRPYDILQKYGVNKLDAKADQNYAVRSYFFVMLAIL